VSVLIRYLKTENYQTDTTKERISLIIMGKKDKLK
jgi:hypothetical protein